jgi:NAD(P)-dependent dehydrogenase (short-subunit alcohol dehydrogenase family)
MGIISMMIEAKSLHGYYPIVHMPLYSPLAMIYQVVSICWLLLTSPLTGDIVAPYNVAQQFMVKGSGGDQKQVVAIVTGANTGIGYETARSLVLDHDMTVILACRSTEKGLAAAEKINAQLVNKKKQKTTTTTDDSTSTPSSSSSSQEGQGGEECNENSGRAIFYPLDLTSSDSVTEFSTQIKSDFPQKIDILVNNAGMAMGKSSTTGNKMDLVFQSNFLGHYQLTSQLLDAFVPGARIVNLSSVMHHFVGMFDIEDAKIWQGCCLADQAPTQTYPFSKVGALFFSMELNRRYGNRIRSIAVNPGAV